MSISGSLPTNTINNSGRSTLSEEAEILQRISDLDQRFKNHLTEFGQVEETANDNKSRLESIHEDGGPIQTLTKDTNLNTEALIRAANNNLLYFTSGGHTLTIGTFNKSDGTAFNSHFYVYVSAALNGLSYRVTSPITIATGDSRTIEGRTVVRSGDLILVKSLPSGNLIASFISNTLGFPTDAFQITQTSLISRAPVNTSSVQALNELLIARIFFNGTLTVRVVLGNITLVNDQTVTSRNIDTSATFNLIATGSQLETILNNLGTTTVGTATFYNLQLDVRVSSGSTLVEDFNYFVPLRAA